MGKIETFSIRQMVELTGLSEFSIRGWENRYAAFHPRRSKTGRRAYSKGDIERAMLLRELVKRGHKISRIARLQRPQLQELFERPSTQNGKSPSPLAAKALDLLMLQKWIDLQDLIRGIPAQNGSRLAHNFILPCLALLGEGVKNDQISIAQEHVFSSLLKEKIYASLSLQKARPATSKSSPCFVLATPEGDFHELGLLLAHLFIRAQGISCAYLGLHTPPRELAETALRFGANHLLIVSTIGHQERAPHGLLSYLQKTREGMGQAVEFWVAGSQAPPAEPHENAFFHVIPDFQDLERRLKLLQLNEEGT